MRKTHDARHHLIGRGNLGLNVADPTADRYCHAAVPTFTHHIVGMHQKLTARLAFHQPMVIVHPRIVVSNVTPSNQPISPNRRGSFVNQSVNIAQDLRDGEPNAFIGGPKSIRAGWLQGSKIDARRMFQQLFNTDLPFAGIPIRPSSQRRIDQLMRWMTGHGLKTQEVSYPLTQFSKDLPVV